METDPSFSERTVIGKKANLVGIMKPQCCYNVATVFYCEMSSPVVFNKLNFKKYQKYL